MIDTPPDVARLHRDLFMRRSGGERLRIAAEMFETAKRLARAGLGDADGRDESPEMRARLFVRIHGPDFDPATRDRIVAWLLRPP